METILMSIHPKWCEKIFSGEKTIEVRKTAPKPPFKVVVYCTKGEKLYLDYEGMIKWSGGYHINENNSADNYNDQLLNGKVIGEFICDKVEEFAVGSWRCDDIETLACLSYKEMVNYFYKPEEIDWNTCKWGKALHITAPVLYDKPKELCDYKTVRFVRGYHKKNETMIERLKNSKRVEVTYVSKAPQNYMRIEEV